MCDGEDRILREHREYIGPATNNEAEFRAILRGLSLAARFTQGSVVVTSDSELVVRQLTGAYAIREPRLEELAARVGEEARAFRSVEFRHRPRMSGRLARADALANEALDRIGKEKSR